MLNMTPSITIEINIEQQTLTLFDEGSPWLCYRVSTGVNGPGEQMNSGCTPRGRHLIRAKIGEGCAHTSVFVGRRVTGELYTSELAEQFPTRDWILGRILWLSGCEVGVNRLGNVDTMRRYIYIHGTPDSEPMGIPLSHGCVRMRTLDVVDLFDHVDIGADVIIA